MDKKKYSYILLDESPLIEGKLYKLTLRPKSRDAMMSFEAGQSIEIQMPNGETFFRSNARQPFGSTALFRNET